MSEIITKRSLPHWYVPGAAQFVTFRLANSLPQSFLDQMRQLKSRLLGQPLPSAMTLSEYRQQVHKKIFAGYDQQLDNEIGDDAKWLADPMIAALIRRSLHFHNGKKYDLLAYTIMPNHVHILLLPYDIAIRDADSGFQEIEIGETPDKSSPLSSIMHSLKSYTAHEANKLLKRTGQFWQHESYDHWVRDDDEMERIVEYINLNAVNANLARNCHEFFWSSAHDRYLQDGDLSGWLPPIE